MKGISRKAWWFMLGACIGHDIYHMDYFMSIGWPIPFKLTLYFLGMSLFGLLIYGLYKILR